MNEMDLNWLIGFIEGEGCFGVSVQIKHKKGIPNSLGILITFKLGLHEKDIGTLIYIKKLIGFGKISFVNKKYWKKHNAGNQYVYSIHNHKDCLKLANILDENLFRSTKRTAFVLWKEALTLRDNEEHLTFNGIKRIVEIRSEINPGGKKQIIKSKDEIMKIINTHFKQVYDTKRVKINIKHIRKKRGSYSPNQTYIKSFYD